MICEARLQPSAGLPQWMVGFHNEVRPYKFGRPIVVRLISQGQKFRCKDGHIRDTRMHSDDVQGMEYEVEFVDLEGQFGAVLDRVGRVARFFTADVDLICELTSVGIHNFAALGWKKIDSGWKSVAWRVER